jgi:hypothetical protein
MERIRMTQRMSVKEQVRRLGHLRRQVATLSRTSLTMVLRLWSGLLYKEETASRVSGNFFPVNGVILLGTVRPGMSGGQ